MSYSRTIKDPALKSALRSVVKMAMTNVNVLITGETGSGKDFLALAVQQTSSRSDKAFITLNCAELPENLVEPLLFGSCKGAFTCADEDTLGICATADSGTLFLDEINSLPLSAQAKLLRFIETGEYLPVGSNKTHAADVRIIAATNIDMASLIRDGQFQQDLYIRLNVISLNLPPLRDRRRHINLLLKHYLIQCAKKFSVRTPKLDNEALAALEIYPWPGNVRELRNLCEGLTLARLRRPIELKDLPDGYRNCRAIEETDITTRPTEFKLPERGLNWDDLERDLIVQALTRANGKCAGAAKLLGLSRDALYYRINKHGLALGTYGTQ
jgi:DNA-binding NtrC family response regulator